MDDTIQNLEMRLRIEVRHLLALQDLRSVSRLNIRKVFIERRINSTSQNIGNLSDAIAALRETNL